MKKIFYLITLLTIFTTSVFAIEANNNIDEFGLVLARSKAGFIGTTKMYNPIGDVTGSISANLKGASYVYGKNGDTLRVYKRSRDRILSYDSAGNVIGTYLLDGNNNATQYDKDGNVVASYKYDYSTESVLCYSKEGFMTGRFITDINGKTRKYDQYGNITNLYYSDGLQAVNINVGVNGVINGVFNKVFDSRR